MKIKSTCSVFLWSFGQLFKAPTVALWGGMLFADTVLTPIVAIVRLVFTHGTLIEDRHPSPSHFIAYRILTLFNMQAEQYSHKN